MACMDVRYLPGRYHQGYYFITLRIIEIVITFFQIKLNE